MVLLGAGTRSFENVVSGFRMCLSSARVSTAQTFRDAILFTRACCIYVPFLKPTASMAYRALCLWPRRKQGEVGQPCRTTCEEDFVVGAEHRNSRMSNASTALKGMLLCGSHIMKDRGPAYKWYHA